MVQCELSISNVGTPTLTISVQVSSGYRLKYIDIDSQDTYISNGPSAHTVWSKEYNGNVLNRTEVIPTEDLEGACLNKDVLFIYITSELIGAESESVHKQLFIIYNKQIELIKALKFCGDCNQCERPSGLINHILQMQAIKYAIDAGDSDRVKCYWDKYFKVKNECGNSQPCGCR